MSADHDSDADAPNGEHSEPAGDTSRDAERYRELENPDDPELIDDVADSDVTLEDVEHSGATYRGLENWTREDFEEHREKFRHHEDDIAQLQLELPTAVVASIGLELTEGATIGEWIRGAIWNRLSLRHPPEREIEVEVPLDETQWDRLRHRALARQQTGDDRDDALLAWDSWNELVGLSPTPIVGGERKSMPEDLVDVDADDCS